MLKDEQLSELKHEEYTPNPLDLQLTITGMRTSVRCSNPPSTPPS